MKNVTYINASAGSGKTYTLTHKLAELIKEGKVRPDQVIMTTFTVKAANEMKEEAKKVLYENGLFEAATQLDQAMIGTIHSVANSLIKKYWFFLGLSPDMGVMADEDTTFYISQSLSDLPTHDELKQLHAFFESVGIQFGYMSGKSGLNYDYWKKDIENVISYTTNYEIEDYGRSVKESLGFIRQFVHPNVAINHSSSELKAVLDEHQAFLESQKESGKKQERLVEIRRLRRDIRHPNIEWYKRLSKLLCALQKCGPLAGSMREELTDLWHSRMVYDEQEKYIRLLFKMAERWKERFPHRSGGSSSLRFAGQARPIRRGPSPRSLCPHRPKSRKASRTAWRTFLRDCPSQAAGKPETVLPSRKRRRLHLTGRQQDWTGAPMKRRRSSAQRQAKLQSTSFSAA